MSILELFCDVDDFVQEYWEPWEQTLVQNGKQRQRAHEMHPSEIMTMLIHFH